MTLWYEFKPIDLPGNPVLTATAPRFETNDIKRCSRCNAYHPITNFGLNKGQSDGLSYYCKPCDREVKKEAKERQAKRMKAWRNERSA